MIRATAEEIGDVCPDVIEVPISEIPVEESDSAEEQTELEETDPDEVQRDLVAAFFADVSQVSLLTRQEEEVLGTEISQRRERVRRLLRAHPAMVSAALKSAGRGVVHPDDDFREREALRVLDHARARLRATRRNQRGYKTLSKLVSCLERELAAYRELRDRMLTANVRLVMTLAGRYRHPTLSYLDLVQEGILGLMRAVEKYEPARGIKFGTYAVWWIWQQISRAADCQGAMIRTPVHWNQMRRKLGRSARHSEGDFDQEVLAERHGLSTERLATMAQSFQCLSLAAPIADGDDRTLGDTLASDSEGDPEEAILSSDLNRRLVSAVGTLPAREAEILRLRFGLDGVQSYTLEEIGQRFGVSRERIRQLEARALKQMREICDSTGLADGLH
jgi:RNA polymerase primary sigma factor